MSRSRICTFSYSIFIVCRALSKKNFKKYRKGDKFKVRTITLDSGKKVMKFLEDDELKLINALNLVPTIDK